MRHPLKFILWVLPVLGIVLGYAYAYLFFHGLLETWHFVGKPDENIARIDGIGEARKLLVTTETGKIYSFEFGNISLNGFIIMREKSLSHPNRRGKKKSMILSIQFILSNITVQIISLGPRSFRLYNGMRRHICIGWKVKAKSSLL